MCIGLKEAATSRTTEPGSTPTGASVRPIADGTKRGRGTPSWTYLRARTKPRKRS
jgi:hypothetical protein